jgi:hypothetical protein
MQHFKSNQYAAVVHKICLQQYYLNMTAAVNVSGQLQQLNAANKKKTPPIHKSTTHDEHTSAHQLVSQHTPRYKNQEHRLHVLT